MPNPSGKNSPSSFDEFAPQTAYGGREKANDLKKAAPVAGDGAQFLGSARRATELALKSGQEQNDKRAAEKSAQPPVIPPQQQAPQPEDGVEAIWAAIAATPGASDLARQYAAGA